MWNPFKRDQEFYSTLIRIALPISIQNLIGSSLNMVDTVMIGQMGETEIAAVGLANQITFLLNLFLFGISSGAAIFMAQYWGKRDIGNIRRVLGLGMILGVGVSLLFTLVSFLFPRQVMGVFSKDIRVIELGGQYLQIVCISFAMSAITVSYAFALRSTEQVKLPMMVSIIALGTNTVLNYVLIFGKFGFPMLGVAGAAIATVIARLVETLLTVGITYSRKYAPAARWKEMFDLSYDFIVKYLNTTVPVILNESLWSLGMTMFMVAYARMGTGVVAAMNIASTIERIAMVLFFGMASACAVMVGNQIGAGEEDKAFATARKLSILGPSLGCLMGLILALGSHGALSIYRISPEVYSAARVVMIIFAATMPMRIFNTINIVGILRSGGDTKFSLIIDTAGLWFIAVPLAFLGGLVWKLPIHWVYILVTLEEFFKFTLGVIRFASKKWINNLVSAPEAEGIPSVS